MLTKCWRVSNGLINVFAPAVIARKVGVGVEVGIGRRWGWGRRGVGHARARTAGWGGCADLEVPVLTLPVLHGSSGDLFRMSGLPMRYRTAGR